MAISYAIALLPADIARRVTDPNEALSSNRSKRYGRVRLISLLRTLDALCVVALDRIHQPLKRAGAKTGSRGDAAARDDRLPELTDTERAVYKVIAGQPRRRGIQGKEIVKALQKQGLTLEETTLRRHVIPLLKAIMGVGNSKARGGYYLPD
jgi:hypothetical protein